MARDGRGRLSSLDLVPEVAQGEIIWAMGELNARQRSQADILFELNERLEDLGVDPISKSAFNRRAVRTAMVANRIAESRALFAGIADQFTPDAVDETNVVIGELIKILIAELLDYGAKEISTKGAMELSRAYLATIQGQKISTDRRSKAEADFVKKAGDAIGKVGKSRGLSQETINALRGDILGIKAE